jgi:hypothetical protein
MPLCQIYLISHADSGLYSRYTSGYSILEGGDAGEKLVDLDLTKFILHHYPGGTRIRLSQVISIGIFGVVGMDGERDRGEKRRAGHSVPVPGCLV